jgi:O-antigen/teichoic acid export membrane protein
VSEHRRRQFAFARLLGSAVVSQALLSAAGFAVGLLLIRRTSDLEYGSYILASSAILLLVSLQNAFFAPTLAVRMVRLDRAGRGALVDSLYVGQRGVLACAGAAIGAVALCLWWAGVLDRHAGALVLAGMLAALAVLHREFFRMVLLARRRPLDVLRTDAAHVLLLLVGVFAATLTPAPAMLALAGLGVAALGSGVLLSAALTRHEAWRGEGAPGLVREIAPLAAWSTAGAAIHWTFSQGSIYVVAATLDVTAVAAIAATRLLLMPINLLSTGIGSLMLPLASGWLQRHGPQLLLRRLAVFALGVGVAALGYFVLLWWWREEIFAVVLRKQFDQRDALLLLWGLVFLVMVVRDQLVYLVAAQGRFRVLTLLTLASAAVSLTTGYLGMRVLGAPGALVGMLVGESVSVIGIVMLSLQRAPARVAAPA